MKKTLAFLLAMLMVVPAFAMADPATTEGTAEGFGGPVTVKVTVDGDKITAVEAMGEKETPDIGGKALEALAAAMVEANSADVDAIAGATVTSEAVKKAVKTALGMAEAEPMMDPAAAEAARTEALAAAEYTYGVGMIASGRVGPGKDDKENQIYSLNQVFGFVVFDKEGRVAFSTIDIIELASSNAGEDHGPLFTGWPGQAPITDASETPAEESFLAEVSRFVTKREKGDSYRMNSGTWAQEMDGFQNHFVGMTVDEIEAWFETYTSSRGRPLTDGLEGDDKAKYDALSDEEKAMLADVTSTATMSLRDNHGDMLGIYREAWENRQPFSLGK